MITDISYWGIASSLTLLAMTKKGLTLFAMTNRRGVIASRRRGNLRGVSRILPLLGKGIGILNNL